MQSRLQGAYPGNIVREDDEFSIGLPLDISSEATETEIVAMAKTLADKVIAAMVPA
jgi:hypothetical protein